MSKAARRARKKENRELGRQQRQELATSYVDGIPPDEFQAYISTRYVCERCGLEQPVRRDEGTEGIAPCAGPLGLRCSGTTARSLEAVLNSQKR